MARSGIMRMWFSTYFQQEVWPAFKKVYPIDARKVEEAVAGKNPPRPASAFALGIFEEVKLHRPAPTPPPPPPPPPPEEPWKSGYAPQAYNKGSGGQDARYNIKINCVQQPDGLYKDGRNVLYDDGGRDKGGRSGDPVPGLKPADMMDQKEPWEAYEWMGKTIGPDKEDYPAESYRQ